MNEKEFCLSNEAFNLEGACMFHINDVQEFINLLKDKIENAEQSGYINNEQIDLRTEIDKLAGEKFK